MSTYKAKFDTCICHVTGPKTFHVYEDSDAGKYWKGPSLFNHFLQTGIMSHPGWPTWYSDTQNLGSLKPKFFGSFSWVLGGSLQCSGWDDKPWLQPWTELSVGLFIGAELELWPHVLKFDVWFWPTVERSSFSCLWKRSFPHFLALWAVLTELGRRVWVFWVCVLG